MDFYAETEKRKNKHLGHIGQLAYEGHQLSRESESIQRRIAEIDELIAGHEQAIQEADQAQRNFNTYLAIQEGAVTAEQLAEAIKTGANLEAPTEPKK